MHKHLPLLAAALWLAATPAWSAPPQAAPAGDSSAAAQTQAQREPKDPQQDTDTLAQRMRIVAIPAASGSAQTRVLSFHTHSGDGALGLVLDGTKVTAVTPGGAAETAGVHVGDIIIGIDGKPLRAGDSLAATLENRQRLSRFTAGTRYRLKISRDGKPQTLKVTAQQRPTAAWASVPARGSSISIGHPANVDMLKALLARSSTAAKSGSTKPMAIHMAWTGLKLASLNPDLASYFGTPHGALVLSLAPGRYPGLKAGDVIVAAADKPVTNAHDFLRNLHNRTEKKPLDLDIVRHGKHHSIQLKMPKPMIVLLPVMPTPTADQAGK